MDRRSDAADIIACRKRTAVDPNTIQDTPAGDNGASDDIAADDVAGDDVAINRREIRLLQTVRRNPADVPADQPMCPRTDLVQRNLCKTPKTAP